MHIEILTFIKLFVTIFMKKLLIFLYLFLVHSITGLASTQKYEDHQAIKKQVTSHIIQQASFLGNDVTARVNNIDQRLRLKKCTAPLQIRTTGNELKPGRNTLNVSCLSDTPWRIFLTSHIEVFKDIYVAKKLLRKGAVVTSSDLTLKKTNITSLHKRYLSNKTGIINQSVKRTIAKGDLFTTNNLTDQLLIKKGDLINIIASNRGFVINMKGTALANGSEGQRITVKNSRTKRIVQGTVTDKATVRVQI